MNTGFLGPAVATVLTVYGIETLCGQGNVPFVCALRLQQCLPFTVLKPIHLHRYHSNNSQLQQCLPFTVLKRY